MAVYVVYEPPRRRRDALAHAERFVFVRDGFSFWAFLFGPLWMLWHRLWLALIGYLGLVVVLLVALQVADVGSGGRPLAAFLLMLLVGFEGASLRRWKLERRGWNNLGVVVADRRESAERRFFDVWVREEMGPPAAAPVPSPSLGLPPMSGQPMPKGGATSDVIGLFPQPGVHP